MSEVLGEISVVNGGWRGSQELWLDAAYDVLINAGVQNVRILYLAKKLKLSRTSFYWFFKDRDELLDALLQKWRVKNMMGLSARTQAKTRTIAAAVLGVSHLWTEEETFDCEFEFAVRSWGLESEKVLNLVWQVDDERLSLIRAMFLRHDFTQTEADIRARTLYQVQIGYISMRLYRRETMEERIARMVDYTHVFAGQKPTKQDWEDFTALYMK